MYAEVFATAMLTAPFCTVACARVCSTCVQQAGLDVGTRSGSIESQCGWMKAIHRGM